MKLDIYANYGMLANEKRTIYTLTPDAEANEKVSVIIPDHLIGGENINGDLLISFDGIEYPLADVLTSRYNKPALLIPGPAMYHGYVALETV